jgi:hypothetical protein
MRVVIEFYRTRDADDAHAVVGREIVETVDLGGAIAIGRLLARTLDMPQRPDAMTVADTCGKILFSGVIGAEAINDGRQ